MAGSPALVGASLTALQALPLPPAPPSSLSSCLSWSLPLLQEASVLSKQMVCFVLFCLACATFKNVYLDTN